jgi:hypothetical protein
MQKPIHRYEQMTSCLQNTFDLLVGVSKVREHIPRKETVHDVLHERIEFVNGVLFFCVFMAQSADF